MRHDKGDWLVLEQAQKLGAIVPLLGGSPLRSGPMVQERVSPLQTSSRSREEFWRQGFILFRCTYIVAVIPWDVVFGFGISWREADGD